MDPRFFNKLFASTARGLEELLKNELEMLGASNCKLVQCGVHFQGDDRVLYQSLLWSRLASRILLPLNEFSANNDQDLYLGVQSIDWSTIFSVDKTFVVHFSGVNDRIRNSQYGALKVKDAIVDSFVSKTKQRPSVAKQQPDIRIHVFLQRNTVSIALDLSGDALHQRGYRELAGQAPLKENLAAAIILRSGWQSGTPVVDPLCGSGTFLIEAAMMAADRAPGLYRQHWGFSAWQVFNKELWHQLIREAQMRFTAGLQRAGSCFFGSDSDPRMIEIAGINAVRAGVAELITFNTHDISKLVNPFPQGVVGNIISNPPYGERLESEPALIALHNLLGRVMKTAFGGWRLSLFSASPGLLSCLQLRAEREFKTKNGALDCIQKNYQLSATRHCTRGIHIAEDFANRLRKNKRKLEKWAQQQGIECYRLYDADLPEYNVAVDRYGSKIVVQEYAAPKTIDEKKARKRLFDVINATLAVLELPSNQLILKTRERQKGKKQYEKLAQQGEFFLVNEYNAKLWVNLTDYLDTGLFLDHRIARQMLGKMSQGKDFLNLFAYTGTATVHAGLGGARSTTTLDMSRTYLQWAEKNLQANRLNGQQHRLIQADCLSWLNSSRGQFDIIFVDPPTFSNSKRMETTFDVQRDHLCLINSLKRLLRTNGTIMFSNNKRGFQMDLMRIEALGLVAKDISVQTQSTDFERHRQIHHCWLLTHTSKEE